MLPTIDLLTIEPLCYLHTLRFSCKFRLEFSNNFLIYFVAEFLWKCRKNKPDLKILNLVLLWAWISQIFMDFSMDFEPFNFFQISHLAKSLHDRSFGSLPVSTTTSKVDPCLSVNCCPVIFQIKHNFVLLQLCVHNIPDE